MSTLRRRRPGSPGGASGHPPARPAAGHRRWWVASAVASALAVALLPAATPASAATLAVAPLSDRQGDPAVAAAAQAAVLAALAEEHTLVDGAALRDVLRRGRIRVLDDALPEELRQVAAATGADRLVTLTLHQSAYRRTPLLALSGRAYDGASGELLWAGFEAASGLDGRTLLGLGVVDDPALLARRAGRRLAADLLDRGRDRGRRGSSGATDAGALGTVALVPFGSVTDAAGTNAAETVTEVVRATLHRRGARLAAPSAVARILRQRRWTAWGGVDAETRRALGDELGARWILTGSVERYDVAGSGVEPEPQVAVSLRLLDAATGRIAWMGGRDGAGWDGQGPFRTGRTYSRGDLTQELVGSLVASMTRQLLREPAGSR